MHTHRRLIVNTALMTGSSIVMRCIALVFQAWLVGHIGAAGIGLYQLVLSVSVLFATFAISGIRFAATRLISEEMGLERGAGVTGAMRRCASRASACRASRSRQSWTGTSPPPAACGSRRSCI